MQEQQSSEEIALCAFEKCSQGSKVEAFET
jgi:hypothetical protein